MGQGSTGDSLPEWFPLAIYDSDLSLEQWLGAFVMRMAAQAKWRNAPHLGREEHVRTFLGLAAITPEEDSSLLNTDHPKRLWPIQEPSVLQILYAAALVKSGGPEVRDLVAALPDHADKFLGSITSKAYETLSDMSFGSVGDHSHWTDVVGGKWALATIDLDQDDETLELIFKGWLASCREAMGTSAQRPFDDTDRKKWANYQLLAAFDLNHCATMSGTKYTDAQMGRALWDRPGMDSSAVDLTERYRKTVKPMLSMVFHWRYLTRLWRQLELLRVVETVAAQMQEEGPRKAAS